MSEGTNHKLRQGDGLPALLPSAAMYGAKYSWRMGTGPFLQMPVVDADDNIMKMATYGPLAPPLPPPPQQCLTIIAAPESPPTTIVIRKIPTSIRQKDMLKFLDSFCRETNLPHQPHDSAEFEFFPKQKLPAAPSMSSDIEIDYAHMPLSRKGLHKGFAVVNFTKFKAALMFNVIHHKRAVEIGQTSFVCEVAFAEIQGVEAHLQKWRLGSTSMSNHVSQEPLVFDPPCNGLVSCLSDRLQGQKLSTLDKETMEYNEELNRLHMEPSTTTSSSLMLSPELAPDMEGDVGSKLAWHLSSSPLSLQSLPSVLNADIASTAAATKSCDEKEERKREGLEGKNMNVVGVQMGSNKKRRGKDHVVAWPLNMMSMKMRGKLGAPLSNEPVPEKKRKKFRKEQERNGGSAATSTSSSLAQQALLINASPSRLAQIEEEDKDHKDAIPLRQRFAWIYNDMLRFICNRLSKLTVSQIVLYVKRN
ncbi:hypothetical protein L7F22_065581 [Adiantum nelumboides]|nr:hypothetical protein [Adiantum nelumboides]